MTSANALPAYSEPAKAVTYAAPEHVHFVSPPPMLHGYPPYPPPPFVNSGPIGINPNVFVNPLMTQIRDWLPWSIINIFMGWGLFGMIPLVFSLICRSKKRSNDASGARTMSTLALISNIVVMLGGLAGWIGLIVAVVISTQSVARYTTRCYYPYC